MNLPILYPILDADTLSATCAPGKLLQSLCAQALALAEAGCTLLQYRAKRLPPRELLTHARELRRILPAITLIMNDRADLCLAAGFDGVHLGQDDLSPEGARLVLGARVLGASVLGESALIGLSTHNPVQFAEALTKPVNYLAIGPVFTTASKQNPDPEVGVSGVAEARRLRGASGLALPLVAIGGITRANAEAVLKAGADSVAVIGDISQSPRESAKEFFRLMM